MFYRHKKENFGADSKSSQVGMWIGISLLLLLLIVGIVLYFKKKQEKQNFGRF